LKYLIVSRISCAIPLSCHFDLEIPLISLMDKYLYLTAGASPSRHTYGHPYILAKTPVPNQGSSSFIFMMSPAQKPYTAIRKSA